MEPFAREEFGNFFKVSADKVVKIRMRYAKCQFAGTAETAGHIALQFGKVFKLLVAQKAFGMAERCHAGDNFHAPFGSISNDVFDFVNGIDFVVCRQLITGGLDAVFQVKQQAVVTGVSQQSYKFFDEFHSFHLPSYIQLRPANIHLSHNQRFLSFIYIIKFMCDQVNILQKKFFSINLKSFFIF